MLKLLLLNADQKERVRRVLKFGDSKILMLLMAAFFAGLCAIIPNLAGQGLPTIPHGKIKFACQKCHDAKDHQKLLKSPEFNHSDTRYALMEMHKRIPCMDCHTSLVFSNAGNQCSDCHADIHRRQMGSDCEQCHTARGWQEVKKNVNGHRNRFPLIGAHAAVECESCHKSAAVGLFRGLNTECSSCHLEDYNKAAVNHVDAGFSTRCESCHSSDRWNQRFNHGGVTGFALTGAHAPLDCTQCHANNKFTGTPAACVSCHLQAFNNTTNPNHITAGFSQGCSVCHSAAAWIPAVYNHRGTAFPLTGAHAQLQCQACHQNGQYVGLPTDCNSCHASAYNSVTDPNHVTAGFPRDCTACHTTTSWIGATFSHTQFPIYSGAHANRWTACSDCHTSSSNYAVFTCITCHTKTTVDSRHHDVSGYVYSSANCYACHPSGRAG
jgi:hypothetical protein